MKAVLCFLGILGALLAIYANDPLMYASDVEKFYDNNVYIEEEDPDYMDAPSFVQEGEDESDAILNQAANEAMGEGNESSGVDWKDAARQIENEAELKLADKSGADAALSFGKKETNKMSNEIRTEGEANRDSVDANGNRSRDQVTGAEQRAEKAVNGAKATLDSNINNGEAKIQSAVEKEGSESRSTTRNAAERMKQASENFASTLQDTARSEASRVQGDEASERRAERREEGRVSGAIGELKSGQDIAREKDAVRRETERNQAEVKKVEGEQKREDERSKFREAGNLIKSEGSELKSVMNNDIEKDKERDEFAKLRRQQRRQFGDMDESKQWKSMDNLVENEGKGDLKKDFSELQKDMKREDNVREMEEKFKRIGDRVVGEVDGKKKLEKEVGNLKKDFKQTEGDMEKDRERAEDKTEKSFEKMRDGAAERREAEKTKDLFRREAARAEESSTIGQLKSDVKSGFESSKETLAGVGKRVEGDISNEERAQAQDAQFDSMKSAIEKASAGMQKQIQKEGPTVAGEIASGESAAENQKEISQVKKAIENAGTQGENMPEEVGDKLAKDSASAQASMLRAETSLDSTQNAAKSGLKKTLDAQKEDTLLNMASQSREQGKFLNYQEEAREASTRKELKDERRKENKKKNK